MPLLETTFSGGGPTYPDPALSTISALPVVIESNGTATSAITVQVNDQNGDPWHLGGATVDLFTTAGTLGAVTDNGDGTYSAVLTASAIEETATVTGEYDGVAIGTPATVEFIAVFPVAANSVITAAPDTLPSDGVSTSTITVQINDQNGDPWAIGGDAVVLFSTSGDLSAVTDNADGTYTATLTSDGSIGVSDITGTYEGTAIGTPATVLFEEPPSAEFPYEITPAITGIPPLITEDWELPLSGLPYLSAFKKLLVGALTPTGEGTHAGVAILDLALKSEFKHTLLLLEPDLSEFDTIVYQGESRVMTLDELLAPYYHQVRFITSGEIDSLTLAPTIKDYLADRDILELKSPLLRVAEVCALIVLAVIVTMDG